MLKRFIIFIFLFFPYFGLSSHELKPAVSDISILDQKVNISLKFNSELILAGINAENLSNTDESLQSMTYDYFLTLPAKELKFHFDLKKQDFLNSIFVFVNGNRKNLNQVSHKISVEKTTNDQGPRDTIISLSLNIPSKESTFQIGWAKRFGPLIVRQADNKNINDDSLLYSKYLSKGAITDPLFELKEPKISFFKNFFDYLLIGYEHIIPKGLDHILFIIGIFIYSLRLKDVLIQSALFTIAHSVTLIASSIHIINLSPVFVESMIALSISYVAVENLFRKEKSGLWSKVKKTLKFRYLIIFIFGLLHGLGFASMLQEIGINQYHFISSLLAFNIGVELGQIVIIAFLYISIGLFFSKLKIYDDFIKFPICIGIGFIGLYWFIERALLQSV